MDEIQLSVMLHSPQTEDVLRGLLAQFEAQERVRVRLWLLDWVTARAELTRMAMYQQGPDVSEVGTTWIPDLVAMNGLRPFTPKELAGIGGREAFVPVSWQTVSLTHDPACWALPWLAETYAIHYRRDWLRQAGVDEASAFVDHAALDATAARRAAPRGGVPGEQPRHTHGNAVGNAAGKVAVGRIDVGNTALAVGYHGAERQAVDDRPRNGARFVARCEAEQPGGDGEQAEHPHDRQDAQKHQDEIGRDAFAQRRKRDGHDDEERGQRRNAPQSCGTARTAHQRIGIIVLVEWPCCHLASLCSGQCNHGESGVPSTSSKCRVGLGSAKHGFPRPRRLALPFRFVLEPHDETDDLGHGLEVVGRDRLVDVDTGEEGPRQRRILDDRHAVLGRHGADA